MARTRQRCIPLLASLLLLANSASCQEWRIEEVNPTQGGMANIVQPGLARSLRVSESTPGVFAVHESSPFITGMAADACVTRTRKARLESTNQTQVLTVTPAMGGCPEVRFLFRPDGSGWEEAKSNGQWIATGSRLVGDRQVASSRPAPESAVMVAAAPAAPPAQPAVVTAPAVAPPPAQAAAAEKPAAHRELPMASTARRRALVIGNDSYRHVAALQNARADARAMAAALARSGFQVTTKLDLDERGFKVALREFRNSIEGGDEVVVFYAGHGVQVAGANYLLPVDIHGDSEDQVRDDATPLQRVLDDLSDRRARFTLAVVDACRDNPFRGSGRAIGARGLAPTTAATGQMVIYSAGSGQQALDKLGPADKDPNGLFTRVFVRAMEEPGVPVDRLLRSVRSEVGRLARSVGHTQTPALYDQTEGEFILHPSP